jgi:hypothetical protein
MAAQGSTAQTGASPPRVKSCGPNLCGKLAIARNSGFDDECIVTI